jgi:endonuclease-3
LIRLLEELEAFHGPQLPNWPTDPWMFLVWWHCGYPASDAACAKGWASMKGKFGLEPEQILAADPKQLAMALKAGGMVPELRAMRLKEIAERVQKEFDGDLYGALKRMPLPEARAALKKFPNIADPGADRILLFAGISPIAAVPSNCPHVLVRIQLGQERKNYGRTYTEAQEILAAGVPAKLDARSRAYLLLKTHGQKICKSTNPKCKDCPVAPKCAFFNGKMRGRPAPKWGGPPGPQLTGSNC